MRLVVLSLCSLGCALLLSACGQKGALYLPDDPNHPSHTKILPTPSSAPAKE